MREVVGQRAIGLPPTSSVQDVAARLWMQQAAQLIRTLQDEVSALKEKLEALEK